MQSCIALTIRGENELGNILDPNLAYQPDVN